MIGFKKSRTLFILLFVVTTGHTSSSLSSGIYTDIIASLSQHIKGEITLTDSDFENNHDLLIQNIEILATDQDAISKSFELLVEFDTSIGPLFTTSNTRNGINRSYTGDGLNLHRNIILIHQGLIDYTYNSTILDGNPALLENQVFLSAQYFPGFVDQPQDAGAIETARVKCSYLLAEGSQPWADIGNPNMIRPTGSYLAPGSIAEVTLPQSLIGKGIKIRVGAHYWDLANKGRYKRMDRVSITYDVNAVITKIAHPLGGGIYLEVPLGVDEGLIDVSLKNVIRAPFFSMKTFSTTSLQEWQDVERKHLAPWTDFETDKFMMQVPTSWIYNFDDPKTLLENWDKSMDAVSDLLGRPRITDRHKNYLQFDVIIRGSAYHPGYPMSNTPYNPNDATDGTPKHNILRGPQYQQDIHFHELGHEVAISKFSGETEALVNFLYVPVLNKCFGYSLDEAFQNSFGPSYNYVSTKENTIRTRLVAESFCEGIPRNTCSCTKNEVRYQQRGYAHYVDIVDLYGWEALEKFWKTESDSASAGSPFPVNNQEQDDRIFRMSVAAEVDLRPLFHFWGLHPKDPEALAQRMKDNDLVLPMLIKQKLHSYRSLIPKDNEAFVKLGNDLHPNFMDYTGDQFDFGQGWYKKNAEAYDEATAQKIESRLSDIITLYYGTDCYEVEAFIEADFGVEYLQCRNDLLAPLPEITANGISGNWIPNVIDASVLGTYSYLFVPNLEECTLDSVFTVEVYGTRADISGSTYVCHDSTTTLSTKMGYTSYSWALNGVTIGEDNSVSIGQSGILSVSAIDSAGCISEGEISIMQRPELEVAIEVSDAPCYGGFGSAMFMPTNASFEAYSFSMEGDSLLSNMYTVIATDSLGCINAFDFEINQPDSIHISLILGQIMVEGGTEPYDITISTADNIQTVTVVDANGCKSSFQFMVSNTTNVFESGIMIYPNPVSESLFLEFDKTKIKVVKLNLLGSNSQIARQYLPGTKVLDVSNINTGLYTLQLTLENGVKVNKKVSIMR